jgi:hypothetical protein
MYGCFENAVGVQDSAKQPLMRMGYETSGPTPYVVLKSDDGIFARASFYAEKTIALDGRKVQWSITPSVHHVKTHRRSGRIAPDDWGRGLFSHGSKTDETKLPKSWLRVMRKAGKQEGTEEAILVRSCHGSKTDETKLPKSWLRVMRKAWKQEGSEEAILVRSCHGSKADETKLPKSWLRVMRKAWKQEGTEEAILVRSCFHAFLI